MVADTGAFASGGVRGGLSDGLEKGIVREVARSVLLASTRLYMVGTFPELAAHLQLRLKPDTQLEHREVAKAIKHLFIQVAPQVWAASQEDTCC